VIRTLLLWSLADWAILLFASDMLPVRGYWFALGHLLLTLGVLHRSRKWLQDGKVGGLALPIGAAFGPGGMLFLILLSPHLLKLQRARHLTYQTIRMRRYYGARSVTPIERLARILDGRLHYPEPDEVGSLAAMLRHGNLQARYKALEIVVISFEPRLSPLIAMALADEDQTIRALAAAAAAQISYNLAQQRRQLEAKIAPSQNLDDRYALALLLADHGCHNQLLPKAQRARLCQEAAGHVRQISEILPRGDVRRRELRTIGSQIALEVVHHGEAAYQVERDHRLEVAS
jgi:polysaccharide biosynthesis protein PelE